MDSFELARALEEHLRAQLTLGEQCCDRATAARNPRLKSAWIGHFVRISNGMAVTGSALARVIHAKDDAVGMSLLPLRLPGSPRLSEQGYPPQSKIRKTTPGGISHAIRELENPWPSGSPALLSSPARGGGAEQAKRREAEGGVWAKSPLRLGAVAPTHLPRKRGRITRTKSKGGAPRGNRNALKSGAHTAALQEFAKALGAYLRELKAVLALMKAALPAGGCSI
jgi:hypothetical protein